MTQPTIPPCGGELLRARGYLQPLPANNDRCFCKFPIKCGKDAPFNFPFFWKLKTKTNKGTIKTKAHHIFWRTLVKFWTAWEVLKRQPFSSWLKIFLVKNKSFAWNMSHNQKLYSVHIFSSVSGQQKSFFWHSVVFTYWFMFIESLQTAKQAFAYI